jgi:sec-independent protein translocase protein TatA
MPNLGGWEFVILIGILVLLFGAKRLPDMARSIGQSARVFKGEMKGMKGDDAAKQADQPPAAPAAPAQLPPAQTTPTEPAPAPNPAQPNDAAAAQEPTRAAGPGQGSSAAQ